MDPKAKFRPLTQIGNIFSLVALGKNRLVRLYILSFLYILLYIDIINLIQEGGVIVTSFILILLSFWAVIAAISRYKYVTLVEYNRFDFNLN